MDKLAPIERIHGMVSREWERNGIEAVNECTSVERLSGATKNLAEIKCLQDLISRVNMLL